MYTTGVKCTATQFRKNLFSMLDRALQGDMIEVSYKGTPVRLVPLHGASKLARAKRQDTIVGTADLSNDAAMLKKMRTEWEKDWSGI